MLIAYMVWADYIEQGLILQGQIKVYLYPNFVFDMWKGCILEVHCINIHLEIFTK